MTQASAAAEASTERPRRTIASLVRSTEIDTRLLGMIAALAIIWVGFNFLSGGLFLTPRNLWNLSVQSSSIAVMATGMVLIIVSRNIDLSVGSMLGFVGYTMAMVQVMWFPDNPYTWAIALVVGVAAGAVIGGFQGAIIAYFGVPSFIVTLGGFLVWRGLLFEYAQGQTLAPMDHIFALLGGGPTGSLGQWGSWIVGGLACIGIIYSLIASRRRRRRYGFPLRPRWAEVTIGILGCGAVLGAVAIANAYPWPASLATSYANTHNITEPPGGLQIPTGIAFPVLIVLAVGLVMTFIATRRKFGRYVFAIGGNPEAAELGGINVRRTIVSTYVLMGILVAISAAISTARLNAAVTSLGVQNELDVIAAAVIGGTSFSGGIGTVPGAILGAVVMQSLRSGMVLLGLSSPVQDIVVGCVLVAAVGLDTIVRRGRVR
jgi:D-xylose transport system permease protein